MQGPDEALGWGTVLDINATCSGRARALNTLLSGNFPGLADIVGEVSATQVELMEAVKPFFTALYNQVPGTSMESARFNLFTKKKKTSGNLMQHTP